MKILFLGLALLPLSLKAMQKESPIHQLTQASFGISPNDSDKVRILLSNSITPNQTVYGLPTPLHLAAANGKHEIVKSLLDYGADVNKQYKDRETPLHAAIAEINKILKKPKRTEQDTLHFYNYVNTIIHLLNAGAKHNIANNKGITAFNENRHPFVSLLFDTYSKYPIL